MRKFGIVLGFSAMALLALGTMGGNAQQGKGKGKGFGGGFGFGMGGMGKMDPVSLLQREDVKKELDLSEEQTEKIPGAVMKAVGEVLNDKQMTRFRQIELQARGTDAFVKDANLRTKLMISDSQTKTIEEILSDTRKEIQEMMKELQGGGGGGFKGMQEKVAGINKEAKEKVLGVLNADQKKKYKELVGEEFKFQQPQFGKKKADTE
jgi:hypothetical protein